MSVGVISSLIHSLLDRGTITAGRQAAHTYTHAHTHTLIPTPPKSDSRGGSRGLCWHLAVSMICEDCLIILKQPTVTDFAGRLCRFPPVNRRKGSMTSQSGIQWVMFAMCHPLPSPPPPLRQTSQLSHHYTGAKALHWCLSPFWPFSLFPCYYWNTDCSLRGLLGPSAVCSASFLLVLWLWWLVYLFSNCRMFNG